MCIFRWIEWKTGSSSGAWIKGPLSYKKWNNCEINIADILRSIQIKVDQVQPRCLDLFLGCCNNRPSHHVVVIFWMLLQRTLNSASDKVVIFPQVFRVPKKSVTLPGWKILQIYSKNVLKIYWTNILKSPRRMLPCLGDEKWESVVKQRVRNIAGYCGILWLDIRLNRAPRRVLPCLGEQY